MSMGRFSKIFKKPSRNVLAMIHVHALPGTPNSSKSIQEIIDLACKEAETYKEFASDARGSINSVILENMHDIPYVQERSLGPEIVASMSVIAREVRKIWPESEPVGIQVLASANKSAMAVAQAADLQFIRAEGFVFGHVADEGWTDACAGELLRYRKSIGANNVLVFADIKKKHSAHAVTTDVDISETARAAKFFSADGVILTGQSTGTEASDLEFKNVRKAVPDVPVLIGSGVNPTNLNKFADASGFIIGSFFKKNGSWENPIDARRIEDFLETLSKLDRSK